LGVREGKGTAEGGFEEEKEDEEGEKKELCEIHNQRIK